MIHGPAALASPGSKLKMLKAEPCSDHLNQTVYLNNILRQLYANSSLRSTGVHCAELEFIDPAHPVELQTPFGNLSPVWLLVGFPGGSEGKESAGIAGDTGGSGSTPGSGRSPGEGSPRFLSLLTSTSSPSFLFLLCNKQSSLSSSGLRAGVQSLRKAARVSSTRVS